MTIEELDGPAYDIGSQEDRERLLSEALAHAEVLTLSTASRCQRQSEPGDGNPRWRWCYSR